MGRKPPSDPQYAAEGRFQGQIERSFNPRQAAFDHNLARNIRIAQVLAYLALMRQKGIVLAGKVECVGDPPQNFSSSRPNAAAHILPGKIQIGGTDVWLLARNRETQSAFEFVFSGVEHLPVPFNQADSIAENKGAPVGLCAAFEGACQAVIGGGIPPNPRGARLNLDLLKLGWDAWERDAPVALARAIASKGEKPGVPALVGDRWEGYTPESINARFAAPNKQKNRDEALRCLQYYLEDQREKTWGWVIEQIPKRLEEVEARFKG